MIMFKASYYYTPRVERINVDRITTSSVFVGARRQAIKSQYESWHHSFEEAKAECVSKMRTKAEHYRRAVDSAEKMVREAESLTEPTLI